MKSLSIYPFIVLLALAQGVHAHASQTVAKINGKEIGMEDFNKKYQENLRYFHFKAPSKKNVLDDLIKRELGIQEAKRLGLEKDPEIRDRMETVLYHALLEKQLAKEFEKINITDEEAKKYYDANPEIRTSHIFVAVPPGAAKEQENEALKKIKTIQDEHLKKGEMSFAEIAQRYSEGVAAPMGGDIDYQTQDKLDPIYYKTAVDLKKPGAVSGIVRSQFGFHIIKLTGIKPWADTDKAKMKRIVFEKKREAVFEKYMAELRKKAKVSINNALINE